MKISLRRALELAVGPANVAAAGHAVADWFDGRNCSGAADVIREALRDQPDQPAPPAEGEVIWQSIDTAPKDGTEILASDYDAIEIVSWEGFSGAEGWENRLGEAMFPAWWQPLPDHPPLPGEKILSGGEVQP